MGFDRVTDAFAVYGRVLWHDGCTEHWDWTPAPQSAVASVDSASVVLSPGEAPVFAAASAGFDAAAELLIV